MTALHTLRASLVSLVVYSARPHLLPSSAAMLAFVVVRNPGAGAYLLTLTRPFLRAFVTDRMLLFCRSRKARRRLSHPATRS